MPKEDCCLTLCGVCKTWQTRETPLLIEKSNVAKEPIQGIELLRGEKEIKEYKDDEFEEGEK